jgi:hypothetical protein
MQWYYIIDYQGRVVKWFQAKNGDEAVKVFDEGNYPNGYALAIEVNRNREE